MKLYFINAFAFVVCLSVFAQQDPQYTQYIYNMSTVNAAYVKDQPGLISAGLLYRQQWQGIDGAPQTANAFVNFPVKNNVELSANYVRDQIGDAIKVTNNFANIDFAYITQVSRSFKLSYGLKVGFNNFSLNALGSDVASDPALSNRISDNTITLGLGLFLYSNNFYAGISSPNILSKEIEFNGVGVSERANQLFGIAGYIFDISNTSKLKPSVIIQQAIGAPLSFSAGLNYLYSNRFEIGGAYRYQESISAIAGFQITQNLKIGYAYDYSISNFSQLSNGSHEVILILDFDLLSLGKKYVSPRFY